VRLAIATAIVLGIILAACGDDDGATSTPVASGARLEVTSTYFNEGEEIPAAFSCDGDNESPDINWSGAPAATQSFAVSMLDPDAGNFVHWVVYGISESATGIPQGATDENDLADGGRQGENSRGEVGYTGPCPPSGTHTYVFTVYALDTDIHLAAGVSLETLEGAMAGHILASGELRGRFGR